MSAQGPRQQQLFSRESRVTRKVIIIDDAVVFLIHKHQRVDIIRGLMYGAEGCVAKPCTREQILEQIAAWGMD